MVFAACSSSLLKPSAANAIAPAMSSCLERPLNAAPAASSDMHFRTRQGVVPAKGPYLGSPASSGQTLRKPKRLPLASHISMTASLRGPMDPPRCRPPSATGRTRPAHARHPRHHRDAAVRLLLQHQPEPVLRQRLLAKKAAAFLGNSFSPPGSLMCLLAPPGSFCPSVLAWAAFPVLPCLMAQSLRVLSLIPGSAAHSLMPFSGSASRAFLQCPAASSRHSSACCLGAFALALDSAFPISPALTDISLLRSAGGDGRASRLSIPAAGSCHPAVHQKITAH